MKQWYMVIDVAKCENCNNCLLACKDEFVDNDWPGYSLAQPDLGQKWITITGKERGQYPTIDVAYLPAPCQHCDNAPCIKAAKDGAINKRPDGIVIIDPVKARGQKSLVNACPYGAIWWNEEKNVPQKCTFCAHLLDNGWKQPRCVQSCPTGALSMRYVEDKEMQNIIAAEGLEVHEAKHNTAPHVYYKNLYRFNRCFIAGSVAIQVEGKDECANSAGVTLTRVPGETISECVTDNYGDFKFDNLEENSGNYIVDITYPGYENKTIEVDLKTSINIGTIFL